MSGSALFVDLPNFYSHLLESGLDEPRTLRDYFLDWFDFDRLARSLIRQGPIPVWVFYSGQKFGPRENRIQGKHLQAFIKRIDALTGITTFDANIEGQQREAAKYQCAQCGHEGTGEWLSEKGIDASLTVHLFDTMDTWDTAYLLSGDADFVPVVRSLRRRGKIVVGAGFESRSSALVRECYDYVDLPDRFLEQDITAYCIFKSDGLLHHWFNDDVESRRPGTPITLGVNWHMRTSFLDPASNIGFTAQGPIDLSTRTQLMEQLRNHLPGSWVTYTPDKGVFNLRLSPTVWAGVERRPESYTATLPDALHEPDTQSVSYSVKHHYDPHQQRYVIQRTSPE
jgi:uncharacterized LabA/DUF88 family protein